MTTNRNIRKGVAVRQQMLRFVVIPAPKMMTFRNKPQHRRSWRESASREAVYLLWDRAPPGALFLFAGTEGRAWRPAVPQYAKRGEVATYEPYAFVDIGGHSGTSADISGTFWDITRGWR
jgi:hypothetical protein